LVLFQVNYFGLCPKSIEIVQWKIFRYMLPSWVSLSPVYLIFLTAWGAWLMLSTPPVSTICESPARIFWAPFTMDWNPDPHNLLIPRAGFSTGIPTCRLTWRGKKMESEDVFCELMWIELVAHLITWYFWQHEEPDSCYQLLQLAQSVNLQPKYSEHHSLQTGILSHITCWFLRQVFPQVCQHEDWHDEANRWSLKMCSVK
jgi:hypothetical protein